MVKMPKFTGYETVCPFTGRQMDIPYNEEHARIRAQKMAERWRLIESHTERRRVRIAAIVERVKKISRVSS